MQTYIRIALTLAVVIAAVLSGRWVWDYYLFSPWTREGRVSADIITIASDVSGRVEEVLVKNHQPVTAGDILFTLDSARLSAARDSAEAMVARQEANLALAQNRLSQLRNSRRSAIELEQAEIQINVIEAELRQAQSHLESAQLQLQSAVVRAPKDGIIVNPGLQPGNPVRQGEPVISLVVADSFYITGYFEETKLPLVRIGQPAKITLMNGGVTLQGQVESIGSAIALRHHQPDAQLLPQVQQTFNWVRLAQRIPVVIALDEQPQQPILAAGMTASIRLDTD